eukprot:2857816-Alexandrium_andersonii.AAC.1
MAGLGRESCVLPFAPLWPKAKATSSIRCATAACFCSRWSIGRGPSTGCSVCSRGSGSGKVNTCLPESKAEEPRTHG